jgi:two-component system response regulator HydG
MNAVERGVVLSRGDYLAEEELALLLPGGEAAGGSTIGPVTLAAAGSLAYIPGERAAVQGVAQNETAVPGAKTKSLEEVEQETILRMLAVVGGNKSEAARRLGITRRTLHQKLKKYGAM